METAEEKEDNLYLSILNKKYRIRFKDNEGHIIKCGHCMKKSSNADWSKLSIKETPDSIIDRNHPHWEPEWIRCTYSLPYVCVACKGTTHSIGVTEHHFDVNVDPNTEEEYLEEYDVYLPQFFTPTMVIFEIPKKCPKEIKEGLINSFQLAYCDISAAANRLRATLEALISLHFTKAEIGKRKLHDQILLLTKKFSTIGNLSLAIKWIGNEGSHSGAEVRECTLAFAYEAFSKILNIIYGEKEVTLEDVASLVVKVKGRL